MKAPSSVPGATAIRLHGSHGPMARRLERIEPGSRSAGRSATSAVSQSAGQTDFREMSGAPRSASSCYTAVRCMRMNFV